MLWTEHGTWLMVVRDGRDVWSFLGWVGDAERVAEDCRRTGTRFQVLGKAGPHDYCETPRPRRNYSTGVRGEW